MPSDPADLSPTERLLALWDRLGIGAARVASQIPAYLAGRRSWRTARRRRAVHAGAPRPGALRRNPRPAADVTGERGLPAEITARAAARVPGAARLILAGYEATGWAALMGGAKVEADFGAIQRKRLTVTGSTLRGRTIAQKAAIVAALKAKVWPLWGFGKLRTCTHKKFPLVQAADAHRLMESSAHIGKILLAP